jgi:hypothetical protein
MEQFGEKLGDLEIEKSVGCLNLEPRFFIEFRSKVFRTRIASFWAIVF